MTTGADLEIAEKRKFAKAALLSFDLSIFEDFNAELALSSLVEEIDEQLELNDRDTKKGRHDFFKVRGASVDDYAERIFDIPGKGRVIAGIRHAGGNVERPFINVLPNYSLLSAEDLSLVKAELTTSFKVFEPKHLCVWLNPKSQLCRYLEEQSINPSQRYIVAPVKGISRNSLPPKYNEIELSEVTDTSYRDWYESAYKDFHQISPELKDWVPLNDVEEMKDSIQQRLMFDAIVDGKKVGLIAANREKFLGRPGVYFLEIVVSKDYKGKGYAPAMQRKFIDTVLTDAETVWGTIDARNLPSTKTAMRVGRIPIRCEFFIPI